MRTIYRDWLLIEHTNITKYMLHSKVSNSGDVFVKTHLFRHVKLMFFIFSGKFGVFFKDVFCNEPLPATGLRIHESDSRNRVTTKTVTNHQSREFYGMWFPCLRVGLRACTVQFRCGSWILRMCVWERSTTNDFSQKFETKLRKIEKTLVLDPAV